MQHSTVLALDQWRLHLIYVTIFSQNCVLIQKNYCFHKIINNQSVSIVITLDFSLWFCIQIPSCQIFPRKPLCWSTHPPHETYLCWRVTYGGTSPWSECLHWHQRWRWRRLRRQRGHCGYCPAPGKMTPPCHCWRRTGKTLQGRETKQRDLKIKIRNHSLLNHWIENMSYFLTYTNITNLLGVQD